MPWTNSDVGPLNSLLINRKSLIEHRGMNNDFPYICLCVQYLNITEAGVQKNNLHFNYDAKVDHCYREAH
jgi:hypothetical protein